MLHGFPPRWPLTPFARPDPYGLDTHTTGGRSAHASRPAPHFKRPTRQTESAKLGCQVGVETQTFWREVCRGSLARKHAQKHGN